MQITYRRTRGMGETIWDIPVPELQPGWITAPIPSLLTQPFVQTVPAPPAGGIAGWLQQYQVVLLAGAGALLLLAVMKGRR